jgi:hypothetical protein
MRGDSFSLGFGWQMQVPEAAQPHGQMHGGLPTTGDDGTVDSPTDSGRGSEMVGPGRINPRPGGSPRNPPRRNDIEKATIHIEISRYQINSS